MGYEPRSKAITSDFILKSKTPGLLTEFLKENLKCVHFSPIPGRVTITGHPNDDLAPGTLNSILKQARLNMYRFLIVIEKAEGNYSAYSPDLPGCVTTGATREGAERNMYQAIEMYIKGLHEDGLPVPESTSFGEYVSIQ